MTRRMWIAVVAALLIAAVGTVTVPAALGVDASAPVVQKTQTGGESSNGTSESGGTEKFDPIHEFALPPMFGTDKFLKFGAVDLSINKAVIYLWLAALICCTWGIWIARRMQLKPDGKQTFTEVMYEFAHDQIAKATLGDKVFGRYMPYVASLFVFLWVLNILSFFPLPINSETVHWNGHDTGIPVFGLYAAASNINVTLALTLVTFFASHYEGIRLNGPVKYFGSWAPPGGIGIKIMIWPLHALSEVLRLVSLSVRLFANMLAGHLLILMMLGMIIIIGSSLIAIGTVPVALFFYLFEFGLVATLQAFIFAMLSGIYIGFAAEPAH